MSSAPKRYRVGIIGLGARAETFARSLYAGLERGELFGLCDIDEDRTRKFCEYCGLQGVRCFQRSDEFFAQREMDAVIVTTPDFTHLDVARQAFAAGKHVYMEKPLDVTAERCREIIRLRRRSGVRTFMGFNLRASEMTMRVREIVRSGALGPLIHVRALEQLSYAHIASFMRRFHRRAERSGGLLNTKCCHDLDIMQWLVGHEHRIVRVASFGGLNTFRPENAPAGHGATCHECPPAVASACVYRDRAGFVFPVSGKSPIHKTRETGVYGGDLCAYTEDKDIVDNQTVIMEWDHGVRGTFNMVGCQAVGHRDLTLWGERGMLATDSAGKYLRVVRSPSGETVQHEFPPRQGGHGGTDPAMLGRFFDAIEGEDRSDEGLAEGLAATLLAEKALESLRTGRVADIPAADYTA
jgi:predicted dehydrogenase